MSDGGWIREAHAQRHRAELAEQELATARQRLRDNVKRRRSALVAELEEARADLATRDEAWHAGFQAGLEAGRRSAVVTFPQKSRGLPDPDALPGEES